MRMMPVVEQLSIKELNAEKNTDEKDSVSNMSSYIPTSRGMSDFYSRVKFTTLNGPDTLSPDPDVNATINNSKLSIQQY